MIRMDLKTFEDKYSSSESNPALDCEGTNKRLNHQKNQTKESQQNEHRAGIAAN
jgi:hypothetical protein